MKKSTILKGAGLYGVMTGAAAWKFFSLYGKETGGRRKAESIQSLH